DDSGIVSMRNGSGTFVAASRSAGRGAAAARLTYNPILDRGEPTGHHVDLTAAAPEADEAVLPALQQAVSQLPLVAGHHSGYVTQGWEPLRAAVARYLAARGLPTDPDQVVITNGAQQAIDLTVTALVDPGDAVVIESPP